VEGKRLAAFLCQLPPGNGRGRGQGEPRNGQLAAEDIQQLPEGRHQESGVRMVRDHARDAGKNRALHRSCLTAKLNAGVVLTRHPRNERAIDRNRH